MLNITIQEYDCTLVFFSWHKVEDFIAKKYNLSNIDSAYRTDAEHNNDANTKETINDATPLIIKDSSGNGKHVLKNMKY